MNPKYEMIIWWSREDDSFIVEVPELPGCMTHGDTYAEAVTRAEEAMQAWIETAQEDGEEVPQPRGRLIYA